jgi:homogentisate 1,2-dioxygenase
MPRYVRMGQVPAKRHTQFRAPDGALYAEEVFGTRGFSGISSILYHAHPPTQATKFAAAGAMKPDYADDGPLRHRHLKTGAVEPDGDPITGRRVLMGNADVSIAFCRPTEPMSYFYKNADGDDLLFIHEGSGRLETLFGTLPYGRGDYLVVPRGTIYRVVAESAASRMLVVESASAIETPRRYRNEYGQLLEHAPYCERDIRTPAELDTRHEAGQYEVRIKARGELTAYTYDFHPLDVVGWDGYVYPWALNIADFEPITGSLHQPPPVHQTFEGHNFVVCSFVPRVLDYHPNAVPVPYNHSNLESDELLYYCNDKFGSRKGIEEGSITLHPSGLPHGPQPGAVEASLGKTRTEELAVMLDTFRPLHLTRQALKLEDDAYAASWNPARAT